MTVPFSGNSPYKLYALVLKLRPLTTGTLMAFSGDMVHAAFLGWIRSAAPEVAEWLHEGNKRRIFTCSSLQFPVPMARMRDAERENVHLPLRLEQTYTVRVTLLLGELFPLLYEALMHAHVQGSASEQQAFMRLGKQSFVLQEAVMTDDSSDWTGFSSFAALVEQVMGRKLGKVETLGMEFASLTTCNRINRKNKVYGDYFAMLPLPEYIFPMLAIRWRELAPPELAAVVQLERIEQYIQDDGMVIAEHDLRSHYVTFTNHPQKGFVGTCRYQLRGPDEPTTPDAPLTVRQQLFLLARFAFYAGVGYKTTMGMGQVRTI